MKQGALLKDMAGVLDARIMRARGLPVKPRLMTLNVTDLCNCRCTICDIHTRKTTSPELTTDEIFTVLSDPSLSRLDVLRITGGEPFLRGDIPDISEAAQRLTPCRIIYITTNGSFPDRIRKFAEKTLPSARAAFHVQVSIDALDSRHDEMRNTPGTLAKAIESLRVLAGYGKKYKFHFGINQTIVAGNIDQIRPVNKFAEELGAGHNIILGAKHHEGKDMSPAALNGKPLPFETQFPMDKKQIAFFYSECAEIKNKDHLAAVRKNNFSAMLRDMSEEYLNAGGRNRLLNGKNSPAPPCMAMFAHFRLMPDGRVVCCSVLSSQPAGNVREASFTEIWNSPAASKLRRAVARCPGCWIECDINPSVFYSGDIVSWTARKLLLNRTDK